MASLPAARPLREAQRAHHDCADQGHDRDPDDHDTVRVENMRGLELDILNQLAYRSAAVVGPKDDLVSFGLPWLTLRSR